MVRTTCLVKEGFILFIELECSHCGRKFTTNIHGKTAIEDTEKYDTIVCGKPYALRCFCGHDLHKIGAMVDDPILKKRTHNPENRDWDDRKIIRPNYHPKNDMNRVAEL